jgi:DUF4097 and DUF4098 domain-containing protein YvlB
MQRMSGGAQWSLLAAGVAAGVLTVTAFAADSRKEFRYNVAPGASVVIANDSGAVEVKGSAGHQVVIVATTHSDKLEIDCGQTGNRIQAITHFLQHADDTEGRVEYEVLVPGDASVTVRAPGGPVMAEKLRGDVSVEGDAASVYVHDVRNAHVHVRTISGPVTLAGINNGHVEVMSLSGNVQLDSVSGPRVSVNTTKGSIRYNGDFGEGGDYMLVNHSGDIDVTLPAFASVDLSARSILGKVENDFPMREKQHLSSPMPEGRAFAGTSNSGASSVQLRSFSGKIRVQKR